MKLRLFQELCEFNRAFEGVIAGLKRMEKNGYTLPETVREWRAEVLSIQVEVNREFFNEFEADLDRDEEWAFKVQSKHRGETGTVPKSKRRQSNGKRRNLQDA